MKKFATLLTATAIASTFATTGFAEDSVRINADARIRLVSCDSKTGLEKVKCLRASNKLRKVVKKVVKNVVQDRRVKVKDVCAGMTGLRRAKCLHLNRNKKSHSKLIRSAASSSSSSSSSSSTSSSASTGSESSTSSSEGSASSTGSSASSSSVSS
ncbi:MAG: hypothetical protein Q7R81_00455 [Candidatus Peregrinibacteria bacterium]|nr:hypothetical protein [Candidatus Peregrinibacteria bacterium]